MALALMPSARVVAPRLAGHLGVMRVSVLGLALIAAGLLVLSRLDGGSSYWLLFTGLVPLGAGMGLAMTPATAAITDALPVAKQGVGSAVNDLARELGGALGIAVLGSVLHSTYRSHLDPTGLPSRWQNRPARRSRWLRGWVPWSRARRSRHSSTACSSPSAAQQPSWP